MERREMKPFHKIETLFDRDEETHKVIEGQWRLPEFEYNVRVMLEILQGFETSQGIEKLADPAPKVTFGGKTNDAQMPTFLLARLQELFTVEKMQEAFPDCSQVCLYGEGYGAKIQKGGGIYKSDGVDFALFDVKVGDWWLKQQDVQDVADKLQI